MKKFLFVMLAALFTMSLNAATLGTKASYVSIQDSPNQGMAYGLTYGFNVFEGTGFVKSVELGAMGEFSILANSQYNLFMAPVIKVSVPLLYAEAGVGYDLYRQAGINTNDYALFGGAGVEGQLVAGTKIGLGFDAKYDIKATTYSWFIGPRLTTSL